MCGISGIIGWPGGFDDGLLTIKNMSNSLHHRGPDDHDVWYEKKHKIYFGHNRLSILDLSNSGKQPMNSYVEDMLLLLMVKYIIIYDQTIN